MQSLEKGSIRNYLVLIHKQMYNQIDLEAAQLFKFAPGQDYEGHNQDSFNKQKEAKEEGTVLCAWLLSTGTVYRLQ